MRNPFSISTSTTWRPDWPVAGIVGASFVAAVACGPLPRKTYLPAAQPELRPATAEIVETSIQASSTAADGIVDLRIGSGGIFRISGS